MGIIKFLRLIKQALKRWVRKCQIKHHIFEISRKEKANYHALVSGVSFTDSEVKQLKALWKDYFPIVHNNYCRLYKSLNGFDARYIPNDLYGAVFVRVLNPYQYANVLVNKALCGVLFHDILRPLEPVRNIGGYFYDAYSQPKTVDESVKILLDFGKKLIVKPAVDSSCGKGVKILEYYGEEELRTVFSEYKSDFLFQEAVSQSSQTACLNPDSLNTIRVTTLLLNGKFTVLHAAIRCGHPGVAVDNVGAGGMMVGIHSDGTLYDYGVDEKGQKHLAAYNGFPFASHRIENMDSVVRLAEQLHYRLPYCAIAGWDIALTAENRPILIEMNLRYPGILIEQMCTGPLFRERTEEVLRYCKENLSKLYQ